MPHKFNLPLTYAPKIEGVRNGTIRQTIRKGQRYFPGDLIAFHGWEDKPYRSSWTDRTPYYRLTEVISCSVHHWGIWIGREMHDWDSPFCDDLARRDGIVPPTGSALAEVLGQLNGGVNTWSEAQILRWARAGRQEVL